MNLMKKKGPHTFNKYFREAFISPAYTFICRIICQTAFVNGEGSNVSIGLHDVSATQRQLNHVNIK